MQNMHGGVALLRSPSVVDQGHCVESELYKPERHHLEQRLEPRLTKTKYGFRRSCITWFIGMLSGYVPGNAGRHRLLAPG